MQSSETITDLAAALALAQGELENATKDKTNPAFKSKYADITACLDAVRPTYAKHGLCIVQGVEESPDGFIRVSTRLLHKSGQWLESTLAIPLTKRDAQGVGAAATYGRRYGLAAMTGLGQEDDDGNTASNLKVPAVYRKASKTLDVDAVKAALASAKAPEDLDAIAEAYAALPAEQQTALKPLAQEARKRVGFER